MVSSIKNLNNKNIKLSIIVPVYNVEKYVNRCIDSILNQDYKNIELILVDDGSIDKSREICDSYKKDFRVKVFHQQNQGVSSARNLGIEVSTGDYFLFLDADDWLTDNALSKIVCNSNGADLVMYGAYNYIELENNSYKLTKRVDFSGKNHPYLVRDKYKEIFEKSGVLWNKLIKREAISELRFDTNLRYGEDVLFLCKVLDNVKIAYIIPEEFYYYYNNRSGNVVSAQIDVRSLELIDGAKEIYDILKRNDAISSGFTRINMVAHEVIEKIPLTFDGIKENIDYLHAIRDLLRYPSLKERISFYLDGDFKKKIRLGYFFKEFGVTFMCYRIVKDKIGSLK